MGQRYKQIFKKKTNNMNNIKIRKITSLTIMTIMVAGGLTVAAPSFMPEAAAQSNNHLYVSASEYGS